MKKTLLFLSVFIFLVSGNTQVLVHYWNFNNSSTVNSLLTPTSSLVNGADITHIPGGISAVQNTSNTGQGFDITNPNARNGDAAATHLRFNDPIGGGLLFSLPTTGYQDIVIRYGTRRSGSGAGWQIIEYTTDGISFSIFDTIAPLDGNPATETLDFSGITAVNNNPDFSIRITFEQGPGGAVGNNRFDNFTVDAIPAGNDIFPPVATFSPADNAINIAVNVLPAITFNEPVRLVNDIAIDNNNVDTLVELRLNHAQGTPVSFDATFSGQTIIITPSSALLNNQLYYVAIKGGVIEDMSDNALAQTDSSHFTTIALQTVFQPGDIVPVAYRMSANGTDDEVALLTFVNILPGTILQFTDAKYTVNPQPQCAGGLQWQAPPSGIAAGSVITVKNDVPSVSTGILTGSAFGLSSGGDQFIMYTGPDQNPSYAGAFSSNAWISGNVNCGGSFSDIPAGLVDGISSINLSTAPGNVSGNTANGYYSGPQNLPFAQLKDSILDPANWNGTGANTPPQNWPAWNFPGPPSVTSASVLSQNSIQVVFNRDMDPVTVTDIANYTGITGLSGIVQSNNGPLADTIILNYGTPFISGNTYTLNISSVEDADQVAMFGTYIFTFTFSTGISFDDDFLVVNENAGQVSIQLTLDFPSVSSVDLVLKPAPFSTASASDITFTSQTLNYTGNSNTSQTISIPVIDDSGAEQDEYFVLALENANGLQVNGKSYITVYIKDNYRTAPVASQEIALSYVGSFQPSLTSGSTTEIVAHDPATQRLFMSSAIENRLDIADFSNPNNITLISSVDMTPYGSITSVAVQNGIVAVASPNVNEQLNGSVVFFNTNGVFQKQVTVGALPDMIIFSPDGNKVLTANEGQPNDPYTIDPEGTVSIIDISGGIANLTQANVTTLDFTAFNAQETALINAGVRKLKSTSTLSQDLEPEYITISATSDKAWITLQENNAIAEINLQNLTITAIRPLGTKDYSAFGNGFDASDRSGTALISNWPVHAYYIPDAVANYSFNGMTYLVTANEGDEKEYSGLNERTTVGEVTLDSATFPNRDILQEEFNLGRLRITNLAGDPDNDNDYDQLFVNGSRSFSIWNAATQAEVYDSGDDFEKITSEHPQFGAIFNCDNGNNDPKGRSRAKGPEPEGLVLAEINGNTYAFIGLERIGGVMVYNITDPNHVSFVDYQNARSTTSYGGDLGPEGIIYIKPSDSPDNSHYVIVANEISGTLSIYRIINHLSTETHTPGNDFHVYPNPVEGDVLYFNTTTDITVTDITGKIVLTAQNVSMIRTEQLAAGTYILVTKEGISRKFIVR